MSDKKALGLYGLNKMLVIMVGIHNNRYQDSEQGRVTRLLLQNQSGLSLHFLSIPFL